MANEQRTQAHPAMGKLTNHEILRRLRCEREWYHAHDHFRGQTRFPLVVPSTHPLPRVKTGHIQDCCNKSTAIYWANSAAVVLDDIWKTAYEQWIRTDQPDIEFHKFVAKLIVHGRAHAFDLSATSMSEPSANVEDVVKTHLELCDQVAKAKELMASGNFDWENSEGLPYAPVKGHLSWAPEIDKEQHAAFRLMPLFRALIVVIIDPATIPWERRRLDTTSLLVRLVHTGWTEGLSEPIDFRNFPPEAIRESPNADQITTTLPEAIRFILELEQRESKFSDYDSQSAPWDRRSKAHGWIELADFCGYTGSAITPASFIQNRDKDKKIQWHPAMPILDHDRDRDWVPKPPPRPWKK